MPSEYIKKIRTTDGDKQIDYESLANLPKINNTELKGNVDVVESNQGPSNSGKFLGIGPDGNVSPMDPPQGMTEEQAAQIEQNKADISSVKEDVSSLSEEMRIVPPQNTDMFYQENTENLLSAYIGDYIIGTYVNNNKNPVYMHTKNMTLKKDTSYVLQWTPYDNFVNPTAVFYHFDTNGDRLYYDNIGTKLTSIINISSQQYPNYAYSILQYTKSDNESVSYWIDYLRQSKIMLIEGSQRVDYYVPKYEWIPNGYISRKKISDTLFDEIVSESVEQIGNSADISPGPSLGQIVYRADSKSSAGNYLVNAVMYRDGVIIGARENGDLVRIGYDGVEENVLSLSGSGMDWRCLYIDSSENVFASPHASHGNVGQSDRGLYKLEKDGSEFKKVLKLYDPESEVPTESQANDDTIWTMCEDDQGNLYAGVYAHTKRANPSIYKSTDGGETWFLLINFANTEYVSGYDARAMHIHSIIWNPYDKSIYVIIGEINTIYKSTDGGDTWTDLNVTLNVKGSSMLAIPSGILVGSDGGREIWIDLVRNDLSHKTTFTGWANTVFAIRQSDVTGILYAFTKIDSSISNNNLWPPEEVNEVETEEEKLSIIDDWADGFFGGKDNQNYKNWKRYFDVVYPIFPEDAFRPQHFGIIASMDGGEHWKPIYRKKVPSTGAYGIWTIGYFYNGECLCGVYTNSGQVQPLVISEGKHKYVKEGCDLGGEIIIRTNASSIVGILPPEDN